MLKQRFFLTIPVICVLVVLFTFLSSDFFFTSAQGLYPDVTATPDIFSEESTLVYIYASEYGATKQTVSTLGHYAPYPDDVSICLYLARERNYDPFDILGMYKRGLPWKEVYRTIGIPLNQTFEEAGINVLSYFIPQRFKHMIAEYNRWRGDARPMDLSDDEVRDLVQLRFVVRKFGITPGEAMHKRNNGKQWHEIILSGGL